MGGMSPHWRDPMQYVFLLAASVARGATCCMRHAGPGFVMLGMGLIVVVGGLFMYVIIPVMADTTLQLVLHAALAAFLLFNIYFNYALSIATDPGTIRPPSAESDLFGDDVDDDSDGEEQEAQLEVNELLPRIRTGPARAAMPLVRPMDPQSAHVVLQKRGDLPEGATYCRRCRLFRPARAHHCSVCDRCIDHMDHHCPWVNNCIGRDNYRYFFNFLVWLALGCYYAVLTSFTPAYGQLTKTQYMKLVNLAAAPPLQWLHAEPATYLQFAFCMACSAGLAVSILAGWHIYLIATAQTSVELQINRSPRNRRQHGGRVVSPYSTGTIHGNWELVFGKCRFKVLSLLPSTRAPPGYRKPARTATRNNAKIAATTANGPPSAEEIV